MPTPPLAWYFRAGDFLRVVGVPFFADIELSARPERADHVWFLIEAVGETVQIAINTLSKRNGDVGFDSRIAVATIHSHYTARRGLPDPGIFLHGGLDYAELEERHDVHYEWRDKAQMESLLLDLGGAATLVEVWGEAFLRPQLGLHQVHSRRSSCAVPEDIIGHDGAIKFHFERERRAEMLLFKFCGQ